MDAVATKFCSSLVKSLQILCNGHLDFSDGIELIGHINIKVDNKLKLNYVLDEQVSKQNDDSTTFCSNSYHSAPPSRQNSIKSSETEDGLLQSLPPPLLKSKTHTSEFSSGQESQRDFSVDVSESVGDDETVTFVKEEKNEEVMVLSEAAEPSVGNVNMAHTEIAASSTRNENSSWFTSRFKTEESVVPSSPNSSEHSFMYQGEESYQQIAARTLWQCSHCLFMFDSNEEFMTHVSKQSGCQKGSVSFCCSVCFLHSDLKLVVDRHLGAHQLDVSDKQFPCDQCHAGFRSSTGLKAHKQVKHSSMPSYQCTICGKAMHNKVNLEGHMNQHKGLKPYGCDSCGRSFSYKQSLKAHEKMCPGRMHFV